MKNKIVAHLGKYTLIGSLVTAVLLIIIAVFPKWSDGVNELLEKLFLVCDGLIKLYPILLLPLASILLFVIIGLIAGLFSKKEKEDTTNEPEKRKSFFFYYFFSFLLSALLLFILSTAFFNPFTNCVPRSVRLLACVVTVYCECVVISSLLAALWLSVVSMWKTNIGVGILLLGILLFCLITNIIPGLLLSDKAHLCSDCASGDYSYYDEESVIEVEEEDGDYYEEYHEYDNSSFCNDMWDDPDNCASNVESALQYALNKYSDYSNVEGSVWAGELEPYEKEWWWNNEWEYRGYCNLHKMVVFIKSHPAILSRFFDMYSYLLYHTVSHKTYNESAAPGIVALLNKAYDDLYRDGEDEGHRRSMEIYSLMSSDEGQWVGSYFDGISKYASEESLAKFRDGEEWINRSDAVWIYSFWARREHEGSTQIVHKILREITKHYR